MAEGVSPRKSWKPWAFAALYIYVSFLIAFVVFARGLANGSGTPAASPLLSRASTLKLVDGTADRPFVFRRLVPEIIGLVERAVPRETASRIDRDMAGDTTRNAFPGADYHQANLQHSIAFLVWVSALTLFAITLRKVFERLHPGLPILHHVGPVLGLLGVPAFSYVNFYVYDAATPLIFALAIYLALNECWSHFWLLLIPAAYHKETAVVLPVIYWAFAMEKQGGRRAVLIASGQVLLVAAILVGLRLFYADNPGESMEIHVASNWHALTHPKLITFLLVGLMVGVFISVRRALPSLPLALRRCCLILLPTAFALYLVTGMFLEVRSLLELWPLLCAILIPQVFSVHPDAAEG